VRRWLVVVIGSLIVTSCTSGGETPQASRAPSPPPPSSPNPSPTERVPRGVRLVLDTPGAHEILADGDAIYSVWQDFRSPGHPERIARFDLDTGRVIQSSGFRGGADAVIVDGSIWTTGVGPDTRNGELVIRRFRTTDLSPLSVIRLPGPPLALAATPKAIWVGTLRHIYRLDLRGRIVAKLGVRGAADSLAIDPKSERLYVSTHPANRYDTSFGLTERDADTGALSARSDFDPGFATNSLAATNRGVWLSSATGNFGGAFFISANGLAGEQNHFIEGYQGINVFFTGGRLWVTGTGDLGPVLTCADARTGRIARHVALPVRVAGDSEYLTGGVVAAGRFVYVAASRGVVRVPQSLCQSE